MEKICEYCGKPFETAYFYQHFCCSTHAKEAYFTRSRGAFEVEPQAQDAEVLYSFECAHCGKRIKIYTKYDQRNKYCCGQCAKAAKMERARQRSAKRHGDNLGLSGGMSLGSLIRREARSVDREEVIEVRICPICGKKFDVDKKHKKYCSDECAKMGERRRAARYYAAKKLKV